jgi:alginate O-acetyltransferase complex protein AlgI
LHLSPSLLDVKFVLLLCVLGLARTVWPPRYRVLLGAVSSALVVGLAAPATLLVISAIATCYLYPMHRLTKARQRSDGPHAGSSVWLGVAIAGLVILLVVFKLYKHFTVPWLGGPRLRADVLSLVGFSYFTFRAISFLHLQAITKIDEVSPWPILYYCLFPTTLTSGPIQKYTDFRQQLDQPVPLGRPLLASAGYRLLRGCFRKLVLAFLLNEVIEVLLAGSPTIFSSTASITLLYLSFYFDFAGYSDMAIGYGLLMGVKVPENFRRPFLATNISEFWRNWHITLVDWFRDNVFIPMGGMQSSRLRAGGIAFLIMVLCGLWHGLTASFLLWGVWHGLLMLSEAISGSKPLAPSLRHGPKYWLRVGWTNARVAAACVFFLPDWGSTLRLLGGLSKW